MRGLYIPNAIDDQKDAEKSITIKFKSVIIIFLRWDICLWGLWSDNFDFFKEIYFEIDTFKISKETQIMFVRP